MDYLYHILIMISIYAILALAANIPVGLTNLLSLAQATFYGIGAYLASFILLYFNFSIILSFLIISLITGLLSLLISITSLRLKGDYFILATIGFQFIVYSILYNWIELTNGPYGISGISTPNLLFGFELNTNLRYATFSLIIGIIIAVLSFYIIHSPFGRVLKAIRTDEIAIIALGRNVKKFKVISFFISASISSIGGFLYAGYVKYIDPSSFTMDESILIITAIFIGGLGNIKGSIIGATLIILIPEILRFIGLPDISASILRQIIYGLTLILIMRFYPKGIAGNLALK